MTKFVGKKDSLPYIYEECKVRKIKDLLNHKPVYGSTQLFLVHIHKNVIFFVVINLFYMKDAYRLH